MREPTTPADYGLIRPDVLAWMAWRSDQRRRHPRERCYGISSDALADYAVGLLDKVDRRDYPSDPSDLAACERTYRHAPADLQERMLPVLELYRTEVLDTNGYRRRVTWTLAPNDLRDLLTAWGILA